MSDTVTVDPLEAGREAYARRAWPEAYRLLLEADGQGGLDPEDLEALAKSAWWIGLATESIAAFERAYEAPPRAGEPLDGRDDGAHAPPGVRGEDGRLRGQGVAAPRRAPPRG